MTAPAVLAWVNYWKTAPLTSSSAALPAENTQGDLGSPSTAWQSVAGDITSARIRATPATTGQPWRVMGLFGSNITAAATVTFDLITGASTVVSSTVKAGPAAGFGQVVVILPADVNADSMKITIADAANPDGFINIPLVFGGPAWFPASSAGFSSTAGRDDSTLEVASRGGQEYPTLLWQRRRWNVAFDGLRTSEVWAQADAMHRYAKAGSNVFFAPNQSSSTLQQEAIFGRLKSTADISFPYQGADRRRWSAQIAERL